MITRPTALILGAGASAPYGFPTGRRLLTKIVEDLAQGGDLPRMLEYEFGHSQKEIAEFRQELSFSYQPSVDAFLEKRREFLDLGKAVIAAELVPLEVLPDIDRGELEWYEYLIGHLDLGIKNLPDNQLSVITFNYDRSFEAHLLGAIASTNGLSHLEAIQILFNMEIVHVHGKLGRLDVISDRGGRMYEPDAQASKLRLAIGGIQVLHEATTSSYEFGEARRMLAAAKRICFVGFGYLEANLERLGIQELAKNKMSDVDSPYFYGSAFGLGEAQRRRVEAQLKFEIELGTEREKALAFLRNHVVFS